MKANNVNSSDMNRGGMLGNLSSMFKNVDVNQMLKKVNMNQIPASVKQFGNNVSSRFNNMSTTQKVVGGALLAGGLYYLNNRNKSNHKLNRASY